MNRVAIGLVPSVGLSAATTGTAALGAAGVLGASFAGAPTCLFAAVTGAPCPFCGLTHGVAQLGAGNVEAAIALHPLSPLAAVLALAVPVALLRRRSFAPAAGAPPPRRSPAAVSAAAAPPPRRSPAAAHAAVRGSLLVAPAALAALAAIVLLTWIVRLAG